MEFGGTSYDTETNDKKKGSRRVWTKAEEAAMLKILDSVVAEGGRSENGIFKPGTYSQIEKELLRVLPKSGLKASPHVDSKMRKWKKQYAIFCDMLNTSGFKWSDVKKCVEVDNDSTWESYVQSHPQARKWRNKPFPLYGRLNKIFGSDRAIKYGAETPVEMVEEINMEKNNNNDLEVADDCSPMSATQPCSSPHTIRSHSEISTKKRERSRDNLIVGMKEVATAFQRVYSRSVVDKEDRSDIADELAMMGLTEDDEFEALILILDKPSNISAFKSLRGKRKVAFVQWLLRKRARV